MGTSLSLAQIARDTSGNSDCVKTLQENALDDTMFK
jgi:hypothetical protein